MYLAFSDFIVSHKWLPWHPCEHGQESLAIVHIFRPEASHAPSCVAWMSRPHGIANPERVPEQWQSQEKYLSSSIEIRRPNYPGLDQRALAEFLIVGVPVKLSLLNDAHYRQRVQELKQLSDDPSIYRMLRFRITTPRSSPINDVFTQLRQGAGKPNHGMPVFTSAVDLFMLAMIAHCLIIV